MRRRGLTAPVLWAAVLAAATLALQWSGRGALAPPPVGHPGQWNAWLDGRDPVTAAFAILRLVALACLWYLLVATAAGVVLRLLGAARMVAAADRLTVGPVRRLLAGVSLGLAATTVGAVIGPAAVVPAALASQTTSTSTTATSTTVGPAGTPSTITMHRLGPTDSAPAPSPAVPEVSPVSAPPTTAATTPAPQPAAAVAGTWTVRPGQCFWSIAESVLAKAWGRPPTDAEIVPYWNRLIAANGAALVHPADPDLVFPGQVFQVPAP